jgi:RNase adaptor protein for sRNA GlmZ degradation
MKTLIVSLALLSVLVIPASGFDTKHGVPEQADILDIRFHCSPGNKPELTITTFKKVDTEPRTNKQEARKKWTPSGLLLLTSEAVIFAQDSCPSEEINLKTVLNRQ